MCYTFFTFLSTHGCERQRSPLDIRMVIVKWKHLWNCNNVQDNIDYTKYFKNFFYIWKNPTWRCYNCSKPAASICTEERPGPCNWLKSINQIFLIKVSFSAPNVPKYVKKIIIQNLGTFSKNGLFYYKWIEINNIYYIKFNVYLNNFFCEKRNVSTPLGIEPRTFRLLVECSIIWATEVPQNFFHRIYLRQFGHGYIMNYIQIFLNHFSRLCR